MTHSNPTSEPLFRESVNGQGLPGQFPRVVGWEVSPHADVGGRPTGPCCRCPRGSPPRQPPPLGPAAVVAVSTPGQFCDADYCPARLSQLTVSPLWVFIALLQGTHSHLHNLGRRLNLYRGHPKLKSLYFSHVRHKQPNLNFTTN